MRTLESVKKRVQVPLTVAKTQTAIPHPEETRIIQPFLVISHRFGREEIGYGRGDENTLELLAYCLKRGSRAVEFDVWKIEGENGECDFAVFHGPYLQPLTSSKGRLPDVSKSHLAKLITRHGSRIPMLGEVLQRIPPEMQLVNIELKGHTGGTELANYLRTLHEAGKLPFLQNLMISAFDHRTLAEFMLNWGVPKIGLLFSSIDLRMLAYAKAFGAYALNMDDCVVEPSFIQDAKAHGLRVFVWTVNELDRARELARFGVDGIISDRLDLAKYDFTK